VNPIEMAFDKLKARLPAGAQRTVDTRWHAIEPSRVSRRGL